MNRNSAYRSLIKPAFFLLSLFSAIGLVLWLEKVKPSDVGYKDVYKKEVRIEKSGRYPLRKPAGRLSEREKQYGRIAWQYFLNNYQETTGLVNGVDYYPAATFWDTGSYLMGMTSAYEIGIIDSLEFNRRLRKCLLTLSRIELYEGTMPNKLYNTRDLRMVDYENVAVERGIGWSALDLGRFYSFVGRIGFDYPQYLPLVEKVTSRWQLRNMIEQGTMQGVVFTRHDQEPRKLQEGKLGYEEYSSKGIALAGYDVSEALSYTDYLKFVDLDGTPVAADTREVKEYSAFNYVTSEPYMLDGLEYGWDVNSRELAWRIFKVQKDRHRKTGVITCVSEDHVDAAPGFVYNTVYTDGKAWNCVAEDGSDASSLKSISTKAAFAWHVLYDDPYADTLLNAVKELYDPERGWYSGIYEKTGKINKAIAANTNGVILEALSYKMHGPLVRR